MNPTAINLVHKKIRDREAVIKFLANSLKDQRLQLALLQEQYKALKEEEGAA